MKREVIINNVSELRQKRGITQEELGKVVNVTRQTIIAIERGNYTPSVLLALKIAHFFETPVDNIFKLSHEEK